MYSISVCIYIYIYICIALEPLLQRPGVHQGVRVDLGEPRALLRVVRGEVPPKY